MDTDIDALRQGIRDGSNAARATPPAQSPRASAEQVGAEQAMMCAEEWDDG